jgi:hypothetical protein
MDAASPPSRLTENAWRAESSETATPRSDPSVEVIRRYGAPSSKLNIHKPLDCFITSQAGSVTETTATLPLGFAAGAPVRFNVQTSS